METAKMKILYFDTETTGTDPKVNEITQIAGIIEIDGKAVDQFNLRCQPTNWEAIQPEALETTGIGIEQLKTFPEPKVMARELLLIFDRHIDKYNKADKFYPAGHNVSFDLDFLQSFFIKHISKYGSGTYQNWRALDSRVMANFMFATGKYDEQEIPNVKLETLCNHYDIEIDAHDALSDIQATKALIKQYMDIMKGPRCA